MSTQKIRVGIIGVGGMGRAHLNWIRNVPEIKVAALCDISPDSIAATHKQYPETEKLPVYEDYRQMIRKEKLDAVEIVTPHTLHFPMAMDSLDAGLHVLLEKPMVCTVEHALALKAHVEKTKKVFLLSYQRHFDPKFRYIRKLLASRKMGALQYVSALLCQDWKLNQTGKWRSDPALSGGGQLNDSGSHIVDILLWTTGQAATEVYANIDNCGLPVDVNSAITWKFRNGAVGTLAVIGDAPGWVEEWTINCAKGTLYYRDGKMSLHMKGQAPVEPVIKESGCAPERNFVNAILNGEEIDSPPLCGLRVAEFTEAAWESAASKKVIKIARND